MESLLDSINSQTLIFMAAIAVSLLLLKLLFRVLNVGATTILAIVAIFLVLQYAFGISPRRLLFEISHLPYELVRLAKSIS